MNRILILACLFLVLAGCNDDHQPEKLSFNDNWKFTRLDQDEPNKLANVNQGTDWTSQYDVMHVSSKVDIKIPEETLAAEFEQLKTASWEDVSIPHTPKIEDLTVLNQWQGSCYYKKQFLADKKWNDQVCMLEFEGAMHLADIWINAKHVVQHAGGYTPFVVDVSEILKWGELNEILIRLDNRNNSIIPPGKPLENLDFCYYGGIYRDVNLIVKNKIHITHPIFAEEMAGGGVFVTFPEVSPEKAVIQVQAHISNKTDQQEEIEIRQRLLKIDGLFQQRTIGEEVETARKTILVSAGESQHTIQRIEVTDPQLWSPDAPYLYLLKTELLRNGKVVDAEEHRIGIRNIKFSRENGFQINGKKLRLVGSNRHMEYPYAGNAISDQAQYRDVFHIKESGFNTVRLGHYIQDESVLDACDELGLLAIEPIPGWQFFNENEQFCELTYRDIRHMIRRDRNHASIIMWEVILNESWPPAWWKDKASEVAHNEYPGDQCIISGDSYGYYGWDVQYNDWEEGFNRPNNSGKPGFIREYYDYEFGGHFSTTRVKRGDGEKTLLQNAWNAQWSHNRYRAYYPWTAGDAVWSMYDYNRGCCDNICHSGIADIFRIDKFSIPFFKSQIPPNTLLPSGSFGDYIFLATYWNAPPDDGKIIVYANVDEVALVLNAKQIARKTCDKGPDTEYSETKELWYKGGNPFDGGNCNALENAPFTFQNIKWEKGELIAIGYKNGVEVCRNVRRTQGAPSQLEIDYFESGKPASKNDILIVYVRLKDLAGALCVKDNIDIQLEVLKGGEIIGPAALLTEAGIASFLVRTSGFNQLELKGISDVGEVFWVVELVD